ncbi:hypothetical protein [Virgisporangium aurantiacum]|uniref:Uncharacterized protein n=1 Tax=Virgisporangium aurantiacum TaxID=175570 RepID=A0A8J3ZMK2_9ACTN|nr:hypothetical protein [Virgisporangium aurantiacum]GIJ64725.1 hypothetical protein Vau01_122410 [Virgisporangium aurantiacum]
MNHEQVLELITAREAVAATQAEQLRVQIAAFTEQLAVVDAELADLATTRDTLLRLTGTTTSNAAPTDATVASPAYQQILAVFAATSNPLRAKDICVALGTGTAAKNTESLRAKLKASSTAASLPSPSPACSPSPNPRPATLTRRRSHNGHRLPNHPLSWHAGAGEVRRRTVHAHRRPRHRQRLTKATAGAAAAKRLATSCGWVS